MQYRRFLEDQQHAGQWNQCFEQKYSWYATNFGGTFQNPPAIADIG
jgi:hypothetical protein